MAQLLLSLRQPVVTWRPDREPQPLASGTVVVPDADALDADQQRRLLEWVDTLGDVRILSLASKPIYPLVQCGAFLDALYYRLNVLYVELAGSP